MENLENIENENFDLPVKEVSREEITEEVIKWAQKFLGRSFEFREYQLETITNIIYNIVNTKNHCQVIEAPTGSGKSLLNLISAGVLAKVFGKTSYILCSDLYLWKQYEDFLKIHPILKEEFGILKGQTGNYICEMNHEDLRNADCRMAGMSWAKMFDPKAAANAGYPCAARCKYVKERRKCLKAKVVIMTYQLFHYQINVVAKQQEKCTFQEREILFCDECHNIPTIMKNNFAPEIKLADLENFRTLYSYENTNQLDFFDEIYGPKKAEENKDFRPPKTWKEYEACFRNIWEAFKNPESTTLADFQGISGIFDIHRDFKALVEQIEQTLVTKRQVLKQKFTSEDLKYYKACSFFRNSMCFWNDFMNCVQEVGDQYIIKEIGLNKNTKQDYVKFNIVKEDYICYYFLINNSSFTVMMSATTGGFDAFYENVGLKYLESRPGANPDGEVEFVQIPSTFDFTKSPVYFLNRYKMSYREKEANFPLLQNIIYRICQEKFPNGKGMIQTGSYQNAKEIFDSAPKEIKSRLLLYDGSRDKADKITLHQMSKNTILIGPTLVEGIDLPGEDCRFIIILKVPYPVIVDKYVKQKMQLFPAWYNSTTSNTIIQGIGRGNRFKQDFCTTYILDACFLNLYNCTKSQYPKELQNRIQIAG
jgi:Rad3-related DNA helicase